MDQLIDETPAFFEERHTPPKQDRMPFILAVVYAGILYNCAKDDLEAAQSSWLRWAPGGQALLARRKYNVDIASAGYDTALKLSLPTGFVDGV